MSAAKHTRATAAIQRRLDAALLTHLRDLCDAQARELEAQAARIAELERDVWHADARADMWHDQALQLHEECADATGGVPGLTMDGRLVVAHAARLS